MTECLIAFGGNLSNPKVTFQLALETLCENGFALVGKSGLWRSPAWPSGTDQADYLNAVVKHPRMLQRAFVLVPACELESKWVRHARALPETDIRATRYAGTW